MLGLNSHQIISLTPLHSPEQSQFSYCHLMTPYKNTHIQTRQLMKFINSVLDNANIENKKMQILNWTWKIEHLIILLICLFYHDLINPHNIWIWILVTSFWGPHCLSSELIFTTLMTLHFFQGRISLNMSRQSMKQTFR